MDTDTAAGHVGTAHHPKPRSDKRALNVDVNKPEDEVRDQNVTPFPGRAGQCSMLTPVPCVQTVVKGVRRGSWEMVRDPGVGTYYYNYRTEESSWDPPAIFLVRRVDGVQSLS